MNNLESVSCSVHSCTVEKRRVLTMFSNDFLFQINILLVRIIKKLILIYYMHAINIFIIQNKKHESKIKSILKSTKKNICNTFIYNLNMYAHLESLL